MRPWSTTHQILLRTRIFHDILPVPCARGAALLLSPLWHAIHALSRASYPAMSRLLTRVGVVLRIAASKHSVSS